MDLRLKDKRVLITASTRGIGKGIAKVLLEEGCNVVISGRSMESVSRAVNELKRYGRVYGFPADLTVKNDIKNLVEHTVKTLGGLEGLVYVTGPPKAGDFQSLTVEDWEYASKLLLLSAVWITKYSLPYLLKSKGSIIYLSSIATREPEPGITLSNVVRISIAGLTKTLAHELGPKGVRVNSILPGYIETERIVEVTMKRAEIEGISPEDVMERIKQEIPLRRLGKPEEIGYLVAFLLSDKASYINGVSIPIDGGLLKHVF